MWQSGVNPVAPLEFIFAFENPVVIQRIQLHQNLDWPAKKIEILVARDAETYLPLVEKTLPRGDKSAPDFAFTHFKDLSEQARAIKVRILSGYQDQHWGLGEIEVFGTGATMQPDNALFEVNTDIDGLQAGVSYHYRLVATNSSGITRGEDRSFTTPADHRPLAFTGGASQITATDVQVEGRLNPLGLKTQYYFEYGSNTNYGAQSSSVYGGLQITPRSVFTSLRGLKPGTTYHYRLVGVNDKGTAFGDDKTLRTANR